jgi:hypothetical protein
MDPVDLKDARNHDGSFLCFRYGASTIEEAVKKTLNVTPDDMLTLQLPVNDVGTPEDSCLWLQNSLPCFEVSNVIMQRFQFLDDF